MDKCLRYKFDVNFEPHTLLESRVVKHTQPDDLNYFLISSPVYKPTFESESRAVVYHTSVKEVKNHVCTLVLD